jgi:hypothetical protein
MKRFLLLASCTAMFLLSPARADFVDRFENPPYANSSAVARPHLANTGIVAQNSGVWHSWGGGTAGGDCVNVVDPANPGNHVSLFTDSPNGSAPDDCTNFGNILTGNAASLSFDIYVSGVVLSGTYPQINLGPQSFEVYPPLQYGQTLCNGFWSDASGNWVWDAGIGGPGSTLAALSQDVWHHIEILATKSGPQVTFSFALDGTPLAGTRVIANFTDPYGLNAIEMGALGAVDPATGNFVLVDNLVAASLPEPSSLVLTGLGVAGFFGCAWRRGRRR